MVMPYCVRRPQPLILAVLASSSSLSAVVVCCCCSTSCCSIMMLFAVLLWWCRIVCGVLRRPYRPSLCRRHSNSCSIIMLVALWWSCCIICGSALPVSVCIGVLPLSLALGTIVLAKDVSCEHFSRQHTVVYRQNISEWCAFVLTSQRCWRQRRRGKSNRNSEVLVPPHSSTYHISRNWYEIQKIESEFIESEPDVLQARRG